jgi:hypothetical protein
VAAALARGAAPEAARAAAAAEFQGLVGGLGVGPTVDLSRCAFDFDPRVGSACDGRHEPFPAGDVFCPHHAGSVLFP